MPHRRKKKEEEEERRRRKKKEEEEERRKHHHDPILLRLVALHFQTQTTPAILARSYWAHRTKNLILEESYSQMLTQVQKPTFSHHHVRNLIGRDHTAVFPHSSVTHKSIEGVTSKRYPAGSHR